MRRGSVGADLLWTEKKELGVICEVRKCSFFGQRFCCLARPEG